MLKLDHITIELASLQKLNLKPVTRLVSWFYNHDTMIDFS